MIRVDVLLELFFSDLPLDRRVAEIASCGYRAVETWGGGKPEDLALIARAGREAGVSLVSVVLNFPTDDEVAPVRAENRARFLERVDRYSDNALAAGCPAGIVTSGSCIEGLEPERQVENLVEALSEAGALAAGKGFRLNLEPLNTLVDHPGYFLEKRETALEIVKRVALDNVRMLYDIYHMEIMAGNQAEFITSNIEAIGHFHCAGVPGRNEPFEGETNYPFLLRKISEAGYEGYLGLEYRPLMESAESLRKTLSCFAGKGCEA